MRKKISILTLTGLLTGSWFIGLMNNFNEKNNNSSAIINTNINNNISSLYAEDLANIKLNNFYTDLSIFDGSEEIEKDFYLDELKEAVIESNSEYKDLLENVWSSLMYEENDKWNITGLNYEVPKKGVTKTIRIKFTPLNSPYFKGALSFKTTLINSGNTIVDISNIFNKNSIGLVDDNEPETLRRALVKQYTSNEILWSQIDLTEITENSFKIVAIKDSSFYVGHVKQIFKIGIDLKNEVKTTNLGSIISAIDENEILRRTKIMNTNLLIDQVVVDSLEIEKGYAVLKPKNDESRYVGVAEVIFNNVKNLPSIVNNFNLGSFINPTASQIEQRILQYNTNLKKTMFELKTNSISYSSATISAKSGSGYTGSVTFSFNSYLSYVINYDSTKLYVESYKNEYVQSRSGSFSIRAEFGKVNFLNRFKSIRFNTNLKSWHNGSQNNENFINYADLTKTLSLNSSGGSGTYYLYNSTHSNVNWMKSFSTISYSWSGDVLTFRFYTEAFAKASAWNAQYAKAESRTIIKSLNA